MIGSFSGRIFYRFGLHEFQFSVQPLLRFVVQRIRLLLIIHIYVFSRPHRHGHQLLLECCSAVAGIFQRWWRPIIGIHSHELYDFFVGIDGRCRFVVTLVFLVGIRVDDDATTFLFLSTDGIVFLIVGYGMTFRGSGNVLDVSFSWIWDRFIILMLNVIVNTAS